MAIEFARVRYVKRSDGGNACRTAAYNAREDVRSDRTGERFYFSHRTGLLDHQVLLPEGAAERFRDIAALWNAAQAKEKRKDSQEARELLLALPSDPGLSLDDWKTLTTEFSTEHFVTKGVAVQIDIHAPHEGDRNVHAHLLITTRRLEGESFSAGKARDLDPEVRTGKNGKPLVTEGEVWSALWRDFQNAYFERQGLDIRVDETGIVAQRHEGPVRLRTVPEKAQARAAETEAENEAASRDPEQVLAALTRRRATFTELDIERQLLKPVPNAAERAVLRAEILARPEVVALHERGTGEFAGRYTTTAVREEETALLNNAATIAKNTRGVAAQHVAAAAARRTLDGEQHEAFVRATGTDGLVVIEGIAGAGKSYSVEAIREAHERDGWRVVGLAPTNTVAEDMRRSGFKHGSTVHRELYLQEEGRHDQVPAWNRQTCVIVDEAAMLDTRTFSRLMQQAAAAKAKVVLVGDDRQLSSVQRGGMFTAVKEQHGSAVIAKVRRQEADWQRTASEDFANGRVPEALRAYAEHDGLVWANDLDEARTRLLSDWDQDSRTQPEVNRFVYASTNVEVNQLNRDIRAIRRRRGEVEEGLAVETSRGEFEIGVGDRLQLFANDRKAGFYNGTLGTVTAVEGKRLAVETDSGRTVRLDTEEFKEFGLGYAGTVYRGQGKTQTEVQALYDNAFSWNARTAYVGMTRHKETVKLYVPTSLARDELALGRQMSKRMHDEASLAYATAAEVVDLAAVREQQARANSAPAQPSTPPKDETPRRPQTPPASPPKPHSTVPLPRAEIAALRQIDLTAYARDVHGFVVTPDPERAHHYELTRPTMTGSIECLEVLYVPGGYWTYRNPANPRDRGDILDLAKREGAVSLAAARAEIAAYQLERGEPMREPENRRRRAEEKPQATIDPEASDAAEQKVKAEEERRREIFKAEQEDRDDAFTAEQEKRQQALRDAETEKQKFQKEEADRQARLEAEARQVGERERARLRTAQQTPPALHDRYTAYLDGRAEQARQKTGIQGPEEFARTTPMPAIDQAGYPASASLRYTESLARYYDARDPYASLARASLDDSSKFAREQFELNRQIATEADPDRREMLMLRRTIEHSDYMGQSWDRVAGMSQAISGQARSPEVLTERQKAREFQDAAREGRRTWEQKSLEHPALYAPLDERMRARTDAARMQQAEVAPVSKAAAQQPETPAVAVGIQAEAAKPADALQGAEKAAERGNEVVAADQTQRSSEKGTEKQSEQPVQAATATAEKAQRFPNYVKTQPKQANGAGEPDQGQHFPNYVGKKQPAQDGAAAKADQAKATEGQQQKTTPASSVRRGPGR